MRACLRKIITVNEIDNLKFASNFFFGNVSFIILSFNETILVKITIQKYATLKPLERNRITTKEKVEAEERYCNLMRKRATEAHSKGISFVTSKYSAIICLYINKFIDSDLLYE